MGLLLCTWAFWAHAMDSSGQTTYFLSISFLRCKLRITQLAELIVTKHGELFRSVVTVNGLMTPTLEHLEIK